MEKIKTSISIEKDVYQQIKKIALNDDRNFSQLVNKILKEYIKEKA